MTVRIALISLLFCLVAPFQAVAAALPSFSQLASSSPRSHEIGEISGHTRFSYEELDMPDPGESHLGLLGFSFLGDLKYGFYGGIAGYGALRGERGGFFTGGLAGGKTFHLASRLYADAGLFVGGGGGGAAPQGGGLMLRGHAGLILDLDKIRLGAAVSRVKFPNGDIDSDQLSMSVDVPFSFLAGLRPEQSRRQDNSFDIAEGFGVGQQDVVIKAQNYTPASNSENTSGQSLDEDIQTLGFEFRNSICPGVFWLMESSGALGGGADGYAEALFGLGYSKSLDGRGVGFEAALSAGGAGGGRVDTGGGAIAKARIGANLSLTDKYLMALDGIYLKTLDGGEFSAFGVGFRVGWRMHTAVRGGKFSLKKNWKMDRWELGIEHQSYLDPKRKTLTLEDRDVRLISIQFRRYLDGSRSYLSAQAAGAYEGDAGGYASGLVGAGFDWLTDPESPFQLRAELLVGAAGGGGLDVGSGLLVQPVVGLSYRVTPYVTAGLSFGHTWAPRGDMSSHLIGFNISTPFVLPNNSISL